MPPGSGDRYWVLGKYLYDLSGDPHFWINRAIAAHYGLDEVRAEGGQDERMAGARKSAVIPMELKCADNVLEAEIRPEDSRETARQAAYLLLWRTGPCFAPCHIRQGKNSGLAGQGWRFRASKAGLCRFCWPGRYRIEKLPDGVLA